MGLAGRKEKQRIGHDPRNLSWADDANKFGTAYLQKLGWSAGTGLGTTGEGRTSHIKVNQKLDMLGIGAAHQKDPNGIAWKQNKDFENLLRRLNGDSAPPTPVDGFVQAGQETEDEREEIAKSEDGNEGKEGKKKKEKKDKKRKKTKDEGDEEPVKKKRKSKHDNSSDEDSKTKKAKKEKKEKKSKNVITESTSTAPSTASPAVAARPHRAHRARFLAAKRLALSSTLAMDEILGVSRSETATPYPQDSPSIPDTPSEDTQDELKLQELKTSSKSVMDYFKEKLLAKSNAKSASTSTSVSPAPEASTSIPAEEEYDDYSDRPRGGLGLGASRGGLGSSRLRVESTYEEDTETRRTGLGAASHMSAMFTTASSFVSASGDVKVSEEVVVTETDTISVSGKDKKVKEKKVRKGKGKEKDGDEEGKSKSKSKKKSKEKSQDTDEFPAEDSAALDESKKEKRTSKKHSEAEPSADKLREEQGEKRKKRKKDKGKSDSS